MDKCGGDWEISTEHGKVIKLFTSRGIQKAEVNHDDDLYVYYKLSFLKDQLTQEQCRECELHEQGVEEVKNNLEEDSEIYDEGNAEIEDDEHDISDSEESEQSDDGVEMDAADEDAEPFDPVWYSNIDFKSYVGKCNVRSGPTFSVRDFNLPSWCS